MAAISSSLLTSLRAMTEAVRAGEATGLPFLPAVKSSSGLHPARRESLTALYQRDWARKWSGRPAATALSTSLSKSPYGLLAVTPTDAAIEATLGMGPIQIMSSISTSSPYRQASPLSRSSMAANIGASMPQK